MPFGLSRRSFRSPSLPALVATVLVVASPTTHAQQPGAAAVTLDATTGGTLANRQIAAEWQIRDGRLANLIVRNQTAAAQPESISLNQPFSLELKEGAVLRAGDLILDGPAAVEHLAPDPTAARYSERLPGIAVRYHLHDPQQRFTADWSLILRDGSSYIRQSLKVTTGPAPLNLSDIQMIDVTSPTIQVAGVVKGSPLTDRNFFLGFEQPLSQTSIVAGHATCDLLRAVPVGATQSAEYSAVIGIAAPGQMRRDFLAYLERERAHPYRTFLHYNSWFDIGFFTPYTQADALNRIHAIGDQLHVQRGVTLDSFLFDDGWDDHNNLWKIRSDFKDGFEPLKEAAAQYGAAPGVWLSPWGGYDTPKQERLAAANRDGYEIVDGGLALSGPKYYARFHQAVTEMVTKYGVNQFKFDGTGNADRVVTGSVFSSDFDAAIHLIGDLRQLKPEIFINLTTGTYPSPFWLMYADSIWRGGDDTAFAGVGTDRERWITYRDADTYDEVVKTGRLYPLNSLMLHGIVYARQAPHLSTDPGGDFTSEVHSYFGSGTQLQELYITPSLLTPANWDMLAEAARWSRNNASTLVDTHWIGGDPRWLQVYGWAAWSPHKGILTLRNPSDQPQTFTIDIAQAFELPPAAPTTYTAKSPWTSASSQPSIQLKAGEPHPLQLAPFQVLTLEALPQ